MKKFNKIYKLLLVLPLIFMVGCDDSDDIVEVLTQTTTTTVNTVFIETNATHDDSARYAGLGFSNTITVGSNNPVSSDLAVAFSVTKDGGAAVDGSDYTINNAVILESESFGTGDITFLELGRYEVRINSPSGEVNNKEIFVVAPSATISIEWDDSYYDYDHYLFVGNQDFDGEIIANTFGTTSFETFTASLPEGKTSIYIDDYWNDNASIPVILTVDFGGNVSTFDVIMDKDKWVLVIDAGLDEDGNPALTFTDLN
ncbi:hypothetical protein EB822_02560 [Flavobacteriaceae bacterium PRS1]|nr:hypothetical protein EB822_02560 [Flavobacteriaceae bacterium PRS1]